MAARRALEWIGMFEGLAISDLSLSKIGRGKNQKSKNKIMVTKKREKFIMQEFEAMQLVTAYSADI